MKKMRLIVLLLLGFSILFNACMPSDSKQKNGKYGGSLRINAMNIPDLIFPGQVLKSSEHLIVNQVYDGLVKYHPRTMEVVPSLCNYWLVERNGTIYTFYLKKNARFQADPCFSSDEERKITAADVKYSIEQICRMHQNAGHNISMRIENIKGAKDFLSYANPPDSVGINGIEVFDDTTLIFYLNKPDGLFIHFLAGSNALVFSKKAYDSYGMQNTVGSGAYTFKYPENVGEKMTLTANKDYYGRNLQGEKLPFIDTIEISFIISTSRELELLENGQVDMVLELPEAYVTPFLDRNIDAFQSDPPYFYLRQNADMQQRMRYNIFRSNIQGFELNSQNYFDFSETFLREPKAKEVESAE